MKVFGLCFAAVAMTSAVSAGAGTSCDMDPIHAAPPGAPTSPSVVPPATPPVSSVDEPYGGPPPQDDATQQTPKQSDDGTCSQTVAGKVINSFSYTGVHSGGPGSYEQVTDIPSCSKKTVTTTGRVSPLDTGVTLAFRGGMTIFNIAVFDGRNGGWNKVSSYEKGGAATNMVFLNNENVDYMGKSSPEAFAQADGTGVANQSTPFLGTLASAKNPGSPKSILASEVTGAEVHVMTENQCGVNGTVCEGAYKKDGTAFQGWTGGKKIFLTKVSMEECGPPNMPAIWILPDQVSHSGQYGCNSRGQGITGGGGELDIAEVITKDLGYVSTQYYFYDGKYNSGNERFGKRPVNGPTIYVTIIDEDYGIKILELDADSFDFSCGSISPDVVSQWEAVK